LSSPSSPYFWCGGCCGSTFCDFNSSSEIGFCDNSQIFDHTSTLMFLEGFVESKLGKTVREENISAWRRTIAGDLTSAFRPYDPKEPDLD
jgi:phospholipase C